MSTISSPVPTGEPGAPAPRRPSLAIALDVDDADAALALARTVAPYFSVAKVGLELFCVAGPVVVGQLRDEGFEVFVDLKLYDIPTTVQRAARALGRLGVRFATVHAAAGREVVAAAVEGLASGASDGGHGAACVLGVTVLTSEVEASSELLGERLQVLLDAGAGGLVCAATDLAALSGPAAGLMKVVPGIRPPGAATQDQARVATPADAARAGADILVIGRPVSAAADPGRAAAEIAASLSV